MASDTRFLCRWLGLYCLIAALSMAMNGELKAVVMPALAHDAPLLFVLGVLLVLGGLALVLTHNRWTGGGYTVVVTVLCWLTLLKGLVFVLVPPGEAIAFYFGTMRYVQLFYLYAAITAALGVYLCYGGFAVGPRRALEG